MTYRAPVREIALALEAAGLSELAPAFPDLDRDTLNAILEAGADFAAGGQDARGRIELREATWES